jgi:hypothetical protein
MKLSRPILAVTAAVILAPLMHEIATADGDASPEKKTTTIAAAAWLEGRWVGESGATRTEETWTPAEAGTMFASGRTIAGTKTVFFEFLRIEETNGTLAYIAQPRGGSPTTFMLTDSSDTHVTFANPDHDFPREIRYQLVHKGSMDGLMINLVGDEGNGTKVMNYSLVRGKIKTAE